MLHRNPAKRPRMDQLQKEPFFSDINWAKLEKKQLDPPSILKRSLPSAPEKQEEDLMLFEPISLVGLDDEQRGGG